MSNLAAQRKLVEQLRHEAAIDRKKVSQVCKELISFCEAHQQSDVLVSGFTSQKENPFKVTYLHTMYFDFVFSFI